MTETGLEATASRLQELTAEPAEMERVANVVLATNARVLAAARDRLTFEDEPAGFDLAMARSELP
jgi:hypothetical protein